MPDTRSAAITGSPPHETLAELPDELRRIRRFTPLRRLSDGDFVALVRHAHVEQRAAGATLFQAGTDEQWLFYVVDGEVEIVDEQGAGFRLEGGSLETAHPLTPHAKARVRATVTRDACYVRMPAALLDLKGAPRPRGGLVVEELSDDSEALDNQLLFAVSRSLMDGSFALPTLPDVALRIREMANDPRRGVGDLVKLLQADAVIAAHCVKVANSAAYAAPTPVTGVQEAVMRMGVAATRDLVTAFTLKDLFSTLDSATRDLVRGAWRHSSRIAALSYVIARHSARLNAEQALLAGLVHDIGMLVLLREWPRQGGAVADARTLRALAEELNGAVGSMVLRAWRFPDGVVSAALEAERWNRGGQAHLDLADCVTLAHAHDGEPAPWSLPAPPVEQLGAWRRLGDAALDGARRLALVEGAEAEIRAVRELLGAV